MRMSPGQWPPLDGLIRSMMSGDHLRGEGSSLFLLFSPSLLSSNPPKLVHTRAHTSMPYGVETHPARQVL